MLNSKKNFETRLFKTIVAWFNDHNERWVETSGVRRPARALASTEVLSVRPKLTRQSSLPHYPDSSGKKTQKKKEVGEVVIHGCRLTVRNA